MWHKCTAPIVPPAKLGGRWWRQPPKGAGPQGPKVLKVLKVLRFDGPFGPEGCGLPLRGNEYEVSVTELAFVSLWLPRHFERWYQPV